jgi:hypothetical protein
MMIERAGEVEAGMDARDYGVKETLMLVGGGLR